MPRKQKNKTSLASYILSPNVENLSLLGTNNIASIGNKLSSALMQPKINIMICCLVGIFAIQGCSMHQSDTIYMGAYSINLECYDASDLKAKPKQAPITFTRYDNSKNFGRRVIAPPKNSSSDNSIKFPKDETILKASLASMDVSWCSHDSYPDKLHYTLSFEDIFKNNSIPYEQKPEDIYWKVPMSSFVPTVTIEVIDRTLNVYLDTQINVKDLNATNGFRATRFKKLMFTTTVGK